MNTHLPKTLTQYYNFNLSLSPHRELIGIYKRITRTGLIKRSLIREIFLLSEKKDQTLLSNCSTSELWAFRDSRPKPDKT